MRELNFTFDQPQIKINGIVFDLQKSDGDIFSDAIEIQRRYENLDTADTDAVMDAIKDVCGYVDTILGDGAMKKISKGKPIGIVKAIECMVSIASVAAESYSERIADEYE